MKIAVEGCCHGELDAIYAHIERLERQNNYRVDLLLICGDFQAMRTQADLMCMSVPQKYLQMGDFPKYYAGEKVAPILTLVIGGNHEASNYMWELYHGGFLAPNIYYLGAAGVVQLNGLRIAGVSGIYNGHNYHSGHHETVPFDKSTIRSVYHTRHYDVQRLLQLTPPDIFLSHDWPQHIAHHGDLKNLLKRKPYFESDVKTGQLGSPPMMELLKALRPKWWLAAHLHVKFEAVVRHDGSEDDNIEEDGSGLKQQEQEANPDEIQIDIDDDDGGGPMAVASSSKTVAQANPDEIEISLDDDDDEAPKPAPVPAAISEPTASPTSKEEKGKEKEKAGSNVATGAKATRFLALDKCLPKRNYLEIIDVEAPQPHDPPKFTFDAEWLAITKAMHPYLSTERRAIPLPPQDTLKEKISEAQEWVKSHVGDAKDIAEVQTFFQTSPGPVEGFKGKNFPQPAWYTNPQTVAVCDLLEIENKINPPPPGHEAKPTSESLTKS